MTRSGTKTAHRRAPRQKRTPRRDSTSILDLVREGVERFVLNDANMMTFQKAVRAAATKGKSSSHPLTSAAFRRIVREAVRKRKRRRRSSTIKSSTSGGKTTS